MPDSRFGRWALATTIIWSLAAIQDWLSVPDYNARGNIQLIEAA